MPFKFENYSINTENLKEDLETLRAIRHSRTKMVATAAELSGLSYEELIGPNRTQFISRRRWRALYLIHQVTGCYVTTGRLSSKDHSSVMFACAKVREAIAGPDIKVAAE